MSAFSFTKYSSSALNKAATLARHLIIYQSPRVCRGSFFKVSTKTHDLTGRATPQLPATHNSSSIYFNFCFYVYITIMLQLLNEESKSRRTLLSVSNMSKWVEKRVAVSRETGRGGSFRSTQDKKDKGIYMNKLPV